MGPMWRSDLCTFAAMEPASKRVRYEIADSQDSESGLDLGEPLEIPDSDDQGSDLFPESTAGEEHHVNYPSLPVSADTTANSIANQPMNKSFDLQDTSKLHLLKRKHVENTIHRLIPPIRALWCFHAMSMEKQNEASKFDAHMAGSATYNGWTSNSKWMPKSKAKPTFQGIYKRWKYRVTEEINKEEDSDPIIRGVKSRINSFEYDMDTPQVAPSRRSGSNLFESLGLNTTELQQARTRRETVPK
ncbi:hypothetical protein FQN51_000989 [Onygenales sp. PD_10]|nr:hypothetical protein FQN51_000989 [Onygenales sp. PD_10]